MAPTALALATGVEEWLGPETDDAKYKSLSRLYSLIILLNTFLTSSYSSHAVDSRCEMRMNSLVKGSIGRACAPDSFVIVFVESVNFAGDDLCEYFRSRLSTSCLLTWLRFQLMAMSQL